MALVVTGNTDLMDGNELAAQFIRDTQWSDLPDAVQHHSKQCLIDIIAAMVSGVITPISDITAGYAPVARPGDDATVLLHDKRASAAGAAFANACAANALDCDDGGAYEIQHFESELRALLRDEFMTAVQDAGYEEVCWHNPKANGYYQPIVTARNR